MQLDSNNSAKAPLILPFKDCALKFLEITCFESSQLCQDLAATVCTCILRINIFYGIE